ncbi:MAG: hypothetical protein JRJ47_02785 [Deltaproteobacteria bacterium]|nr:hypothetical protein [Deltaproteobacteria bacterium]
MKNLPVLLIGCVFVLCITANSMAESYWVYGADNSEEINGLYEYHGTFNTPRDDGNDCGVNYDEPCPYADLDMPYYKLNGGDYYLVYTGCPLAAQWRILKTPNPPSDFDRGPGWGYLHINETVSPTPPETGWESRYSHPPYTPAPQPTVTLVYNLTLIAEGWGDVTPDNPGVTDFPGYYTPGTNVQLTAAPDPNWAFTGWSGDLTGDTNPQMITMNSDKNVTATFEGLGDYDLLLNIVGSGTVTPDPGGGTYDAGTAVTLTAEGENANWAFSEWSGSLSGRANPAIITMNADKNITATFSDDADGDGISNEDEDAGPNGGDANNDGTQDRLQPEIAVTKTYDNKHYVWLEIESPSGAELVGCQTLAPPAEGCGTWVEFPYGFFEFTIVGVGAGGAATVSLHLPAGGVQDTYYKFGPRPGFPNDECYNFMFEPPTQTGAQINGDVITLYFIDGQRGDDDLASNGTIVDQGGPGVMFAEETIIGPTGGGGGTTGGGSSSAIGGCFIGTASGDSSW